MAQRVQHVGPGLYAGSTGTVIDRKLQSRWVWAPARTGKSGRLLKRTKVQRFFNVILVHWDTDPTGAAISMRKWMNPLSVEFIS